MHQSLSNIAHCAINAEAGQSGLQSALAHHRAYAWNCQHTESCQDVNRSPENASSASHVLSGGLLRCRFVLSCGFRSYNVARREHGNVRQGKAGVYQGIHTRLSGSFRGIDCEDHRSGPHLAIDRLRLEVCWASQTNCTRSAGQPFAANEVHPGTSPP